MSTSRITTEQLLLWSRAESEMIRKFLLFAQLDTRETVCSPRRGLCRTVGHLASYVENSGGGSNCAKVKALLTAGGLLGGCVHHFNSGPRPPHLRECGTMSHGERHRVCYLPDF